MNDMRGEYLPLSDMEDGRSYEGHCRNSTTATWRAKDQRFVYERKKFGETFSEEIFHPEADPNNGCYDVFKPKRLKLCEEDVGDG